MNTAAKSNYPPTYDNGKPRKTVGQIVSYIVLVLWAFISVFPVYWMLTFSLKTNEEIFGENVIGLPKYWVWENYTRAMNTGNMPLYFLNSVIVAVSTIIITLLASVMATYAITRLDWKGRKSMNKFFMLGLTIPIHASIVPLYTTLAKLKMLNSYFALILPYSAFSLAMGILISIGFMGDIPYDLDEACFLDGCGVWGTFLRVIAPLMMPAVATVGIYTFLQCWNELMFANVFISKDSLKTLPVGVQALSGQYTTDWGPIGAALSIATIPTLLVYVFLSKQIQDSFIAGAVKG
ncbi:MAG: carbohydrate ABC transporter permease [Clostridia bacterium]|nr:carbohydrate ABC transporter permease [Clostridia bacterium]MBQ6122267.1 carbohydrate ABC transporter permease [Clostridia bacterium]MBQ9038018.1 carbohydrate ABC transporter permease [Clostridia bacterium]